MAEKTKLCKHCKTEIPKGTKVCPQCGKKQGSVWMAVIAILIILVAIGMATDKPTEENPDSKTTSGSGNEVTKTPKPSEKADKVTPTSEPNNTFRVGDVLETKKVKLSYISCGEYTDENMFVTPADGNKFIYFEFEFENIGDTDTSVGSWDFDCYADGYEVSDVYATADNTMTTITTLSPGRKTKGIAVFEVPQNAEKIEVEYETSYWTQDKAIFVFE